VKVSPEQIVEEIATALEISPNSIGVATTSSDIEEWDSLGHISILSRLDAIFDNVTERIPELASAASVKEILKLLNQ